MTEFLIGLAVLLVSVVIHENAHGITALVLGDDTARKAGRLTLNPIPHVDLVGSIIIPAALFVSTNGRMMFGYAKPVPVVPANLRGTDRMGFAVVAAAGPLSNVLLAFAAAVWFRAYAVPPSGLVLDLIALIIDWNLLLAAFNLLPIPPLDGSRFLRVFLGPEGRRLLDRFEPYGFLLLFLLIFLLQEPLFRVVFFIRDGLFELLPL